ncbi:DUF5666 domain-containing protein [Wukongibacter baidiensis]|uniref:DUF3221 domain-containing protein n=1 Tax=Wukongibacter baidiensis TaxID=1723361 RepID=UPI003D7F1E47
MKRFLVSGLIIAMSMTAMVGCSTPEATDTSGNVKDEAVISSAKLKAADITGKVLEVKEDGKYILIDSQGNTVKGQVWVSITDETNFFEGLSEDIAIGYRDVSRDFEVGNHVEIISTGEIAESYPMQATASAVYVNVAKMVSDSEEYDPQKHGIFKSGVIKEVDASKSTLTLNDENNIEYKVTLNEDTVYVFTTLDKLQAGQEITVRAKYVEDGITDITATEIQLEHDIEADIETETIEKNDK